MGLKYPTTLQLADGLLSMPKKRRNNIDTLALRPANGHQITLWALGCFATLLTNPRLLARSDRIQEQRVYID